MANVKAPRTPLSPELQAAALWTYVQAKLPRFSCQTALAVVNDLGPLPGEDLKHLAKRLKPLLERQSIRIKYTACLEAAARMLGATSWHESEYSGSEPTLQLTVLVGSSVGMDQFMGKVEAFATWREVMPRMAHWCDLRQAQAPVKTFQVHVGEDYVMVGTPEPRGTDRPGDLTNIPIFTLRPCGGRSEWLDGAPSAFEALRRHLEERGVAALEGVAVMQLLQRYADPEYAVGLGQASVTGDAPNAELVLLRDDDELNPHNAFEMARGDELTCWAQLELASSDRGGTYSVELDGRSWVIGDARYTWELHIIRPKEYIPGLEMRQLNEEDTERLLRRFKLVKNIFSGRVRHHEVLKRVEYLGGPRDTYRIDLHRLLLAAKDAGHTWESLCEAMGVKETMQAALPVGFIMSAAQMLSPKKPSEFFARPNISEMARADDDLVLRTLLPRVDTIRYRTHNVPEDKRPMVREAVEELIDKLRVRKMRQVGMFSEEHELPLLVHAHDGEELRLALKEHGLVVYASVLPNFFPLDDLGDKFKGEGIAPFAFGHALYLHIQPE
ncbi:hypothetical protein [Variovorax sp. N23]|uniref:hypothetical protein n=1 Tax=Variovorax sp. N23 TaxID=2980555 RepID=UPI0021CA7A89|nr:hypothetical protein [Variovorax sp. N23]MCU4120051.1 hypothetical protein [Variovorax sp. N23]